MLKDRGLTIKDLAEDFADGTFLIQLAEVPVFLRILVYLIALSLAGAIDFDGRASTPLEQKSNFEGADARKRADCTDTSASARSLSHYH